MPPRGARPPDPYVLSRLDPAHRELVELLYRLYTEQQKVRPKSLAAIGRELGGRRPVGRSTVHAYLHGARIPPDARRLAEVLGGTYTDLDRAADLVRKIQPRRTTVWSLGGDDAPDHLVLRATGRRPGDGRGGDLFTGRTPAIDRIQQWLQVHDCPGKALVVTGQPGAGKSSVVARAVRDLEATGVDGLFFHARGSTRDGLLELVRRQTRDQSITDAQSWMAYLQRRFSAGQEPLLIVVDALDEAVSGSEITRISQLLTSIAAHPAGRVAAATRRGHRDQLLHGLGARIIDASNLVDLDTDAYFDSQDLRRVAARHLTQDDVTHPGPPGHAWTRYREDADLAERLARVIARRAGRSFLVAAFAAHSLSTVTEIVDPAASGFDEKLIPSSLAEAFTKYFDTIPDERQRFRTRRLLTALAFAYGPGLDDDTWLLFAAALGLTATRDDVLQLRRSPVADYLLETRPTEPGQPVHTRLYHQALVDQLRDEAEPDDGSRILGYLTPTDDNGWAVATPYVRRYLIDHTVAGGDLLDLLKRPGYLSVADLQRVLAIVPTQSTDELREIVDILRLGITGSGPFTQLEQTLLLLGAAGHLGLDTWLRRFNKLASNLDGPTLLWAHSISSGPHQIVVGHGDSVNAVGIGRLGDHDVIISASDDHTIRIWDHHGNPIGQPLTGHDGQVTSVAIGRLDDRDVIVAGVSGNFHGSVQIWDQRGNPISEPLTDDSDPVIAVAIGRLGDRDVIISGTVGMLLGSVEIWDQRGNPAIQTLHGLHSVTSVAIGRFGDRDVIISGGGDRTIRIWDQHGHRVSALPAVASVMDIGLNESVVYAAVGRALVAWQFE